MFYTFNNSFTLFKVQLIHVFHLLGSQYGTCRWNNEDQDKEPDKQLDWLTILPIPICSSITNRRNAQILSIFILILWRKNV